MTTTHVYRRGGYAVLGLVATLLVAYTIVLIRQDIELSGYIRSARHITPPPVLRTEIVNADLYDRSSSSDRVFIPSAAPVLLVAGISCTPCASAIQELTTRTTHTTRLVRLAIDLPFDEKGQRRAVDLPSSWTQLRPIEWEVYRARTGIRLLPTIFVLKSTGEIMVAATGRPSSAALDAISRLIDGAPPIQMSTSFFRTVEAVPFNALTTPLAAPQ